MAADSVRVAHSKSLIQYMKDIMIVRTDLAEDSVERIIVSQMKMDVSWFLIWISGAKRKIKR